MLTTAGGVISGGTGAFTIKRDSDAGAVIRFDNTKGLLGYLGVSADGNPIFLNKDGNHSLLLHAGNYATEIGDYYLKTSGGMISGIVDFTSTGYLRHKIDSFASGTGGWIKNMMTIADANWTTKGYISVYGNGDKLNYIYVGCNTYDGVNLRVGEDLLTWGDNPILHSGNVGEYAVGYSLDVTNTFNCNGLSKNHITHGNKWTNTPFEGILSILDMTYSGDWRTQIAGSPSEQKLHARFLYNGTTWSPWKTLAFTDSDITGNAATATALKNKVSLWGNGFDGTQNLSKHIYLHEGNNIAWTIGETNVNNIVTGSTGNFLLGSGGAQLGYNTYLNGNYIYLRSGKSQTIAMTITDGGNIEIAEANNAYTRKLAVGVGGVHIIATTTGLPSLGTPSIGSLLVGSVHYGLQIGTDTNDEASFIQAQRFNNNVAKSLNLNPLGGAVNIGSAGATTTVLGSLITSGSGYGLGFNSTSIYKSNSGILSSTPTITLGIDYVSINCRLSPNYHDQFSLGSDSYR